MLAKDVRQVASAHFLWKLLPTIPEGTRILKLDAWNEAFAMPYPGGLAKQLAKRGPTTCVDRRIDLVQAAATFAPAAKFSCSEWATTCFEDKAFDLIVDCFSTEDWTEEQLAAIQPELNRLLAEGGKIVKATEDDVVTKMVLLRDRSGEQVVTWPSIAVIAMHEGRAVFDGVAE